MNIYKKSLEKLNKNKSKVALIIVIEFIFLMLLFISGNFVYNNLIKDYDLIQDISINPNQGQSTEELNLLQRDLLLLNSALERIFRYIALFIVFSIILAVFCLGYTSSLLNKITNNKKIDKKYFPKFSLLLIVWSLFLAVLILKINFLLNSINGSYIFWGILVLINYFISVSFAVFPVDYNLKEAFQAIYELGVKKFHILFLNYLIAVGIFLLIGYFLTLISKMNDNFSIIGSLILILTFVWFRIFLIELCSRLSK